MAEKTLDRIADKTNIRRYLDIGHAFDIERNPPFRIGTANPHGHRDERDVHAPHCLDKGDAKAAPAGDHAKANFAAVGQGMSAAGKNQNLVGPAYVEIFRQHHDAEEQQNRQPSGKGNDG